MSEPRAVVREIGGKMVLDDPDAVAVIQAVEAHNQGINKKNCMLLFENESERIEHFKKRFLERKMKSSDFVIAIINVDDNYGGPVADILMPNHDWQQYREKGQTPIARGLVDRKFIQEVVDHIGEKNGDRQASEKLESIPGLVTVVISYGVAEVFAV